ncbi:MAG: HAMP domain-containing histidine kinase [Synechococcaceae cyanobacterium RL_1_2]|nr:HAMP domain-containing histidine kinase [Synechococcaceae cyanobacterium RL_1_2]
MFQATRRLLALWYTIVTAIVFVIFATGVYFYVQQTLVDRVDDTLKHVIEVIERSLVIEEKYPYRVNLEASFGANRSNLEDDHIDVEWFNLAGDRRWSTFEQDYNVPLHPYKAVETVHLTPDYLVRQVTTKIVVHQMPLGYLRVSHPWFEVTKPIRQLLVDLVAGASILIGAVGGIGWLLSGIAMQPVTSSYEKLKQFTADASHELRNPIAMIQANVDLALVQTTPDLPTHQEKLEVIKRLTQRLGRLVNDLLFLTRADSGIDPVTYESIPLDAVALEVMEEQAAIAKTQGIELSLDLVSVPGQSMGEDVYQIQGHWDQLVRLLTNLISNSINHGFPPHHQPQQPQIIVRLELAKPGYLQLSVKDNGVGIPAEQLGQIFDRFYRGDPARKFSQSSGLGLAIVAAIVANHQGKITVQSELNQGATFKVDFPVV